jgi:hypothetical protein
MEQIFHNFTHGATGNRFDDYYYVYDSRGRRHFYSKITGKKIAKQDIPKDFHDKIKQKEPELDIGKLVALKNVYLTEMNKLKAKVDEIDVKLNTINADTQREYQKRKEEQDQKDELRRQEYKREREELLRKIFQQHENRPKPSYGNNSYSILQELNISTKKEWKDWLVKNHPDRGGENELCAKVIAAGRSKGW